MNMLLQIVFPATSLNAAISVLTLISLAILGLLEAGGIHLQYSKFFDPKSARNQVPSRVGMFLLYAPAFFAGLASFWVFPQGDLRFLFMKSAVTIHFFKRCLEVLFVHKYSGVMGLQSTIIISFTYLTLGSGMIYAQQLTQGLAEPSMDLKYAGIMVFLIGITGNFYHHYLLSKLRSEGAKEYKIPRGGLFELVICPHYLFEITTFFGMGLISQTLFSFAVALGSATYLTARSFLTRKWYLSKFDDFPKHVKALVPYVF